MKQLKAIAVIFSTAAVIAFGGCRSDLPDPVPSQTSDTIVVESGYHEEALSSEASDIEIDIAIKVET